MKIKYPSTNSKVPLAVSTTLVSYMFLHKGAVYSRRHGACFETQYFPDAVHKEHFEGPVIKAGASYDTVTIYRFRTEA